MAQCYKLFTEIIIIFGHWSVVFMLMAISPSPNRCILAIYGICFVFQSLQAEMLKTFSWRSIFYTAIRYSYLKNTPENSWMKFLLWRHSVISLQRPWISHWSWRNTIKIYVLETIRMLLYFFLSILSIPSLYSFGAVPVSLSLHFAIAKRNQFVLYYPRHPRKHIQLHNRTQFHFMLHTVFANERTNEKKHTKRDRV